MTTFLKFFLIQCLNYGILCWNFRAVAQARYVHIGLSDLCCAAISFTLIKRVAQTDSRAAMAGYIVGGAVGSVVSVWITKTVWGG